MSVLRLSGADALSIASRVFSRPGKSRGQPWHAKTHRIYYGHIVDQAGTVVDEVSLGGQLIGGHLNSHRANMLSYAASDLNVFEHIEYQRCARHSAKLHQMSEQCLASGADGDVLHDTA